MWEDFLRIEDSGWKGKNGASTKKADAETQRYYRGFLDILAKTGSSSLHFLKFNDQIIAGQFGYVDKDVFHSAKVAYDERFRSLSPSNLLGFHVIERFMTDRRSVGIFHLFPYDFGYKHRFATTDASSIDTVLFNNTVRGRLSPASRPSVGS